MLGHFTNRAILPKSESRHWPKCRIGIGSQRIGSPAGICYDSAARLL